VTGTILPGTPRNVALWRVPQNNAPDRWDAATLLPSNGGSGQPVMPVVQEGPQTNNPLISRVIIGAGSSNSQTQFTGGAADGIGLGYSLNVPYPYDPAQTTFGRRVVSRSTGGQLIVPNPLYSEGALAGDDGLRLGQDMRAFLYAQDEGTDTQAVRLTATSAGALSVDSAPIVASDIASQGDFSTLAATVSSLIAANPTRTQAIIQNLSAVATEFVRVGDGAISLTRGLRIAPGETVTLETLAEIFVIPESGTPDVSRIELGGPPPDTLIAGAQGIERGFARFGVAPPAFGTITQDFPNPPGGGLMLQEIAQNNSLTWDIRFEGNGILQDAWTTLTLTTSLGTVILTSADASIFNPNFGTASAWFFNVPTADVLFDGGATGISCTYVFT